MRLTPTLRNWLMAPIAIMLISIVVAAPATGAGEPVAGSQGIDTSLPLTDSAVTVAGRAEFEGLRITINQTKNLTNQALSITWTGGTQTRRAPGQFAANFLQIMQCWGEDDGSVPDNPGPPPEQCVAGATTAVYSGVGAGVLPNGLATRRSISKDDWENYDPLVGFRDPSTGEVWREFLSVDGTKIGSHTNPDYDPRLGGTYWTNPYFNLITTNEVSAASTQREGNGNAIMQVLTGVQSSGLGCGQKVQNVGGVPTVPQCWIVIVPRGEPTSENAGTPFGGERADNFGVSTSPLSSEAWRNRIAVPIDFNPVDSPCSIGDQERRIAGNQLLQQAISRWQPSLCEGGNLPPFSFAPIPDSTARRLLTTPTIGSPGMVVVGRPLDAVQTEPDERILYAPLALSGLVVGFNVERLFTLEAPLSAQENLSGLRVADINLTPRLVAKLLTQSYAAQVNINGSDPGYAWLDGQPDYLGADPDFLQFNPEFELLRIGDRRTFSGLQLPAGTSDAARQVWEWILADPEARAWLGGQSDDWGMEVNPAYSTNPANNTFGISFADPIPTSFPKADPYCFQAEARGIGGAIVPPALCGTDWLPYASSLEETALRVRSSADGARIVDDPFAVRSTDVWRRTGPQLVGRRSIIALTDTSNAAPLGLQVASLSRAGDNGMDRQFIEPDAAGLRLGLESMKPVNEPLFLEPAPSDQAPGSYPLTSVTYAAIAPDAIDDQARRDYSSFIQYAVGAGQEPGFKPGQLPSGYEPLPQPLRDQALIAALAVIEPSATPVGPPSTVPLDPVPPLPLDPVPPLPGVTQVPPDNAAPSSAPTRSSPTSSQRASSTGSDVAATSDPSIPPTPPAEESQAIEAGAPDSGAAESVTSAPRVTVPTPSQGAVPTRVAVPVLGGMALMSALAALELTKRPRRNTTPASQGNSIDNVASSEESPNA